MKFHFSVKVRNRNSPKHGGEGAITLLVTCYYYKEFDERPKWSNSGLTLPWCEIVFVTYRTYSSNFNIKIKISMSHGQTFLVSSQKIYLWISVEKNIKTARTTDYSWIKKYAEVIYFIHWKHVNCRKHVRKQHLSRSDKISFWAGLSILFRKTIKVCYNAENNLFYSLKTCGL